MASTDPGPGPQPGDTFVPATVAGIGGGFPIVRASDLLGSHRTVDTIVERDAIPTALRDEGMTVWITATNELYRLVNGVANANWVLEGSVAGGNVLIRSFAVGVVANDVVYQDATGDVDRANADAAATGLPLGVVRAIDSPAAGQAIVVMGGDVGGFAGLTVGARYILSTADGGIVAESDTGDANYPDTTPGSGHVLAPVGIAGAADTLAVNVGAGIVMEF